jgi:hypothetical protein
MNAGHAKHVSPRSRPVNALLAGVPSTAERVSDTEFEERPTRPAREEGEMVIPGTYVCERGGRHRHAHRNQDRLHHPGH